MSLPRPVDLAHLSRYTGGDRSLNAEVLTLFADQAVDLLKRLEAALAAGDTKAWHDVAHSIKGGAKGIGAFTLADVAAEAEAADPVGDAAEAGRALSDLRARAHAVTLFIQAYLGR